jgi:mRNA interferase RelE/StbE
LTYVIRWRVAARKSLQRIQRSDSEAGARIRFAIAALAENPRPNGAKKLVGQKGKWRVRVGTYRVIYLIDDAALTVMIYAIGKRGGVY